MFGNAQLVYTVSKKAEEMVRAGKAIVSSGGIRLPNGTLFELAKPALQTVTGSITSPITLVSSLANNVQSGFIQHGVNVANKKLDVVLDIQTLTLEKLDGLEKAVGALAHSNILNWASCAFSMANCGISIAGFYMTLKKMDQISTQISALSDKIDRAIISDMVERYDRYRLNLSSDLGLLQTYKTEVSKTPIFEEHLNEIAAFLKRVISEFENREIDGVLGCNLIFGLAIPFAQEIREYSAQFYYENDRFPANYSQWVSILESIDSDSLKDRLKSILIYDHPELHMKDRYIAFSGAVGAVQLQLGNLIYSQELIKQLPQKDYIALDDVITYKLHNNLLAEKGELVCIPLTQGD